MLIFTKKSIFSNSIRFAKIHSTSTCYKQPPDARLKWKRKAMVPPFMRTSFIGDEKVVKIEDDIEVNYPEILPAYPPGKWGSFDKRKAWHWYRRSKELDKYESAMKTLIEFYPLEQNMWHHKLHLPLEFPETLEFSQFLTRTKIIEGLPEVYSDLSDLTIVDKVAERLKRDLSNTLVKQECGSELIRSDQNLKDLHRSQLKGRPVISLMEAIYAALVDTCPSTVHLQDTHIDEHSNVESFVKRTGYDKLPADEVDLTVRDEDGMVKYRISGQNAWQMRSRDPLPQFVDIKDGICYEDGFPDFSFHPSVFDLKPVDCFSYDYLPLNYRYHSKNFVRSIAGHWGRSPFWEGDPCEFGLLGAVHSRRSAKLSAQFQDHPLILSRHALAEGILTAFAWTSAQAFNQGTTLYHDMLYPLTTQLVLTDGKKVQILAYQLNSLNSLWKPEDAGLPYNLAWYSPEENLYDHITDKGEVVGLNRGVLEKLIKLFLLEPRKVSSEELRGGRLSDLPAPRDVYRFMSTVKDKTINVETGETTHEEYRNQFVTSGEPAPRFFSPRKDHPNAVFFFKPADPRELLNEIRLTAPDTARLPEQFETKKENYLKSKKQIYGRIKTLRPPKRWS